MSDNKADEIIRAAAECVALRFVEQYASLQDLCESPIERLLLAALYAEHPIQQFDTIFMGNCEPDEKHARDEAIYVYQQAKVGRYRCDFLIFDVSTPREVKEPRWMVVECDGHNFHEKTKDQAKRDKARDRYFQGRGYRVLRFTGSEIWNDPIGTAEEVLGHLSCEDGWREREQ